MASYLPNESRGETPARQWIETWKSNGIEEKNHERYLEKKKDSDRKRSPTSNATKP